MKEFLNPQIGLFFQEMGLNMNLFPNKTNSKLDINNLKNLKKSSGCSVGTKITKE